MFDLWQQNENTSKDVMPFPDQDAIRHDITWAKFRSKLDMTEDYEQMCIRPEDVRKMKNDILYNIQHFSEPSNGNGRLQCTLHISAVDDCYIPRLPQKVCAHISSWYIHILSEHLRAHRAHNESASMTQRVTILLIKIKAWFILRQNWLSGTCHWRQWHTCWIRQNAVNQGMENSPKLQQSPNIPWTSTIPGTIHARYNSIYHTIIRIGTK